GALDALAELASLAGTVEAHVLAAEHGARLDDRGVLVPDKRFLYSAMARQADLYPRALHLLRELTSSQVIDLPSSVAALDHPDLVEHATSPGVEAADRVQLYRLAWDLIGTEFAGRHHQYEMFYAGAPAVARAHTRRTWRLEEAEALLDRTLAQWDRTTPLPSSPPVADPGPTPGHGPR
ncbi:MAG: 4-hydroxyphenylacetate 3-hydroxylase C-terminal domain-containing protein, partial [Actinomycetota bacterium]